VKNDGPGREALRRAVRKVALAQGREETRQALLDVIQQAQAWRLRLSEARDREADE
jgi:hypothetical protein